MHISPFFRKQNSSANILRVRDNSPAIAVDRRWRVKWRLGGGGRSTPGRGEQRDTNIVSLSTFSAGEQNGAEGRVCIAVLSVLIVNWRIFF